MKQHILPLFICIFLLVPMHIFATEISSSAQDTKLLNEQLYRSLIYVDKSTRNNIIELALLFPDYPWSTTYKDACIAIEHDATVMQYDDIVRVLNECLHACNNLPGDNIKTIQAKLQQYKKVVDAGHAHLSSWQDDEEANQIITRNFDGSREILHLFTRNLTVAGTEIVNGLLTVNGIVALNGRLILNGTDINTAIASAATAAVNANCGNITSVTGGNNINITGTSTTPIVNLTAPVTIANGGTNNTATPNTDGVIYFDGTRLNSTTVGSVNQVLTSGGAGVAPTFEPLSGIQTIATDGGGTASGPTVTFKSLAADGSRQGTAFFSGNDVATITLSWSENTNVGIGENTLPNAGTANNALGFGAGTKVVSGEGNAFIGANAGNATTTGSNNVCIGAGAGSGLAAANSTNILIGTNETGVSGDSSTIRIGSSSLKCFIGGIDTITTTSGIPVFINSSNQLGTTTSSVRFKENIISMPASFSENVLNLNPALFNYIQDDTKTQAWGLIAEKVQEQFPALVIHDKEGLPFSVKYHELPVLLLNELIKRKKESIETKKEVVMLKRRTRHNN